MSWEGFFNFLWILIQAVFWLCALAGAVIVGIVIVVSAWRELRKVLKPWQKEREQYRREANAMAHELYKNDAIFGAESTSAFIKGTDWAWGAAPRILNKK